MQKVQASRVSYASAAGYGLLALALCTAAGLLVMEVCIIAGGPDTLRLIRGARAEPASLQLAISVLMAMWAACCRGGRTWLVRRPYIAGSMSALLAGTAGAAICFIFLVVVEPRPGVIWADAGMWSSLWAAAARLSPPIIAGMVARNLAGSH